MKTWLKGSDCVLVRPAIPQSSVPSEGLASTPPQTVLCGEPEAFWQVAVPASKQTIFNNAKEKAHRAEMCCGYSHHLPHSANDFVQARVFVTVNDNGVYNSYVSAYTSSVLSMFLEIMISEQLSFHITLTIY